MLANNKRWVVLAVALVCTIQVGVVFAKVADVEGVLRQGEEVLLRVRPVDPRSLARGHYSRLEYDISTLDEALVRPGALNRIRRGQQVYVTLQREEEVFVATAVALEPPPQGVFIAGRVVTARSGGQLRVEYGVEAYFTTPERAQAIDKRVQERDQQVLAWVRIGRAGEAVLEELYW